MNVNTRLNILQAQYDHMRCRADADPRVMAKYEDLIEAEYRKTGPTGLNSRLAGLTIRQSMAA